MTESLKQSDKGYALAKWDDPQVQAVYAILCESEMPPNKGEHWEGYTARKIVAAIRTTPSHVVQNVDGLKVVAYKYRRDSATGPAYTSIVDPSPFTNVDISPVVEFDPLVKLADVKALLASVPSTTAQKPEPERYEVVFRRGQQHIYVKGLAVKIATFAPGVGKPDIDRIVDGANAACVLSATRRTHDPEAMLAALVAWAGIKNINMHPLQQDIEKWLANYRADGSAEAKS